MKTLLFLLLALSIYGKDTLRIYISADRTGSSASGTSIEQGVRAAFTEVDNTIGSYYIDIKTLDHRGSTPRFTAHCRSFLEDEKGFAMVGGLHSPPILANRELINKEQILFLNPWAAAGPITRFPSAENWIFRLSIDDSKAGFLISDYAVLKEGFKKPILLLENTGWGRSNEKTMTTALAKQGIVDTQVEWFNWNLGENHAKVMLRKLSKTDGDVIFFVGNAPEGKTVVNAMASLPAKERLPIRSHWGITGGDFPEVIDASTREKVDLLFIQSNFSFLDKPLSEIGERVFETVTKNSSVTVNSAKDIKAPTGLVHSYDLMKILISSLQDIEKGKSAKECRIVVRDKLENLTVPVEGLLKEYHSPFSTWSSGNPDAHEALGPDEWTMAKFAQDNTIILLKK